MNRGIASPSDQGAPLIGGRLARTPNGIAGFRHRRAIFFHL